MAMSSEAPSRPAADDCAELRLEVAARCEEAHAAGQAHAAATEETRARRRDLVAAQHEVEEAVTAADPAVRRVEKAAARDAYLVARKDAADEAAVSEATAAWANAIDRINRQGRLAARAVTHARERAAAAEEAVHTAQRAEQTVRFRAEAAQAACLDGRVRLATCEERVTGAVPVPPGPDEAPAATTGPSGRASVVGGPEPLVVEALVKGDEAILELASAAIAEQGILSPASVKLQLRELVDAISATAGDEGYLVFDQRYPLWAQLSPEESHDVVAALARLGFQLAPHEGWQGGRSPSSADLSMALGYAGLDTRQMRGLPTAVDLAAMPASIGVDASAFLAGQVPDLAVDQLVRLLGGRATALESLWDAWGHVRPVLLSECRVLVAADRPVSG
jgi:hypothetical protein